ncbi:MAG: hypothetical protein J7621_09565 [Niastella sp.]|nr:hypothetical protein [Niastella sp.]
MRFLVPVAVLLATTLLISRMPKGAVADEVIMHPIFTIEMMEAAAPTNTEAGTAYDDVVESSGLLNRLELLDF